MSPNILIFFSLLLELICCGFILLSIFRLLRVNYFNPIVKLFTQSLDPVQRVFTFFLPPLLASILVAVVLRSASLFVVFPTFTLVSIFVISISYVLMLSLIIIFWCILGSVILSWVQPNSSNPLLQIIQEIADKALNPIRKFIPPAGGLDFTPIIGISILNFISFGILRASLPYQAQPFYLFQQLIG